MGILGNTDLLRPMIDTPESRDCFDDISQGAKRASELCRMLLVFAGEGEFTPEPVDINTVVSDSIRFMRSGIARGIQIELDLAKHLPRLEGDSTDLHQMLLVILANAADAIGDTGGGITVKTGAVPAGAAPETSVGDALPPGDYISISVTDTGCGMSEEVASKMFDPFYTTKTRSRGLGLARALGVARAHGGAMNVSTRAGHGTTITVYVAAHAAQSRKAPTILDQESLWHGEGTILVVDDEENVRSITKRMLQRLGFDVLLAADGQEAVEMVSKAAKDLAAVILDLTMPNMDGDSAYAEIRRMEPKLPVLIASGYDVKTVTNRFDRTHISSFIQKPFQIKDLSNHLRDALHTDPPQDV